MYRREGLSPEQITLLKNPTMEGALKFWNYEILGKPIGLAPLAGVHKARLKWPGATLEMRAESMTWLLANNYKVGL